MGYEACMYAVCIYGCGDESQKMGSRERRKEGRKEKGDMWGERLPSDVVCLITI